MPPLALCCVQVLSPNEGNILEDAAAVQILSEAKQVSDDITAKQAVAEETQERIDAARRGYRPCGSTTLRCSSASLTWRVATSSPCTRWGAWAGVGHQTGPYCCLVGC